MTMVGRTPGTLVGQPHLHETPGHRTMRAMWRLPPAVLRQTYGRLGAIAWLLAVTAGVVFIIGIALLAKTAPAP